MPTLGELQARGWHGLQSYCRSCRMGAILLWAYLKLPANSDYERVIKRLRCRRCGERPNADDVRLYFCDTSSADPKSSPP
jgi:hypothetical protein